MSDDVILTSSDAEVPIPEEELERLLKRYHLPGEHEQESHGDWAEGGVGDDRTERAKKSYVPIDRAKRAKSAQFERSVAKLVKGRELPDNEPFDVLVGRNALEVKTIIDGKNPKITMHPESLRRKVEYARQKRLRTHTVVVDARGSSPKYYYRQGLGSFRLSAMVPMTSNQIKAQIR